MRYLHFRRADFFEVSKRTGLGFSLAFLLLLPSSALSATMWWVGGPDPDNVSADTEWGVVGNWKQDNGDGTHTFGNLPSDLLDVYITSSDHSHAGGPPLDPPVSVITSGVDAVTEHLYIGGWPGSFDLASGGGHGNPSNHSGTLDILGGTLELSVNPENTNPKCHYMRLGYRGAVGTINQTGGHVWGCTYFSFGYQAPDALGIWNLDGGTIETYGLDIGVMGTGVVMMDGGSLVPQSRASTVSDYIPPGETEPLVVHHTVNGGRTNIGRGYRGSEDGYETGVGFVNQQSGVFRQGTIRIAEGPGSVGVHAVRAGQVQAISRIEVGYEGHGSIVQSGGWVQAPRVDLGTRSRGVGLYSITGGLLWQSDPNQSFFNGYPGRGAGHVMIVGPRGFFSVQNYRQNSRSRATFMLESDFYLSRHVTPIFAVFEARFDDGAIIDIELEPSASGVSTTKFFTPEPEERFRIVSTQGSIVDLGVELDPDDQADWQLEISSNAIDVRYCPGEAGTAACDGILP